MNDAVRNNPSKSRFELDVDGHTAFAYYKLAPGLITFTHTEVPPEFSGHGVGSRLAKAVLKSARAQKLKVDPAMPVHQRVYSEASGIQRFAEIARR